MVSVERSGRREEAKSLVGGCPRAAKHRIRVVVPRGRTTRVRPRRANVAYAYAAAAAAAVTIATVFNSTISGRTRRDASDARYARQQRSIITTTSASANKAAAHHLIVAAIK